MGEKIFDEHVGGGGEEICPPPVTSQFVNLLTKFGTEIELCIFYPKTEELVLLIYANEFMTSLVCSRALKGIETYTFIFFMLSLHNILKKYQWYFQSL